MQSGIPNALSSPEMFVNAPRPEHNMLPQVVDLASIALDSTVGHPSLESIPKVATEWGRGIDWAIERMQDIVIDLGKAEPEDRQRMELAKVAGSAIATIANRTNYDITA